MAGKDTVDATPWTEENKFFQPRMPNQNEAPSIPADIYDALEYKMDFPKKGKVLIIDNNKFLSTCGGLPDRVGSEKDVSALEESFKSMGFDVVKKKNLCKDDIDKIIGQVISADFSQCGCFICILSSHGEGEGTIWATDGTMDLDTDILEKFYASNASSLVGKPKLFFVQACRGQNKDFGAEIDVRLDTTVKGMEVECCQPVSPTVSETRTAQRQTESVSVGGKVVIPNNADFLVVQASVEGNFSVRNSEQGSWFLQELAKAIKSVEKGEDFLSVLTDVNAKVAYAYQFDNKRVEAMHGMKQMPCFRSTLTKSLILKP